MSTAGVDVLSLRERAFPVAGVDVLSLRERAFPMAGVDVLSLREITPSCCRSSCTYKHATGMFA